MIMAYILDWYSDPSNDTSEPLYVIDIGSGSGKLSYLIMYCLLEMKEFWPLSDHAPFVFVLSDCSEKYVPLWQCNPLLSQFVQMDYLDFAVFDIAAEKELVLINRHLSISPDSLHIPPFFICSCVFSAVPQDVVRVDGDVSRGLLSLYQSSTSLEYQYVLFVRHTCSFSWDYERVPTPATLPWWSLFGESIRCSDFGVFTVPAVAGLFIESALSWCEGRGVFLVSDWSAASGPTEPRITMEGYARMGVDFGLLAAMATRQQGVVRMSALRESFRVASATR